jgi:plastocyanin
VTRLFAISCAALVAALLVPSLGLAAEYRIVIDDMAFGPVPETLRVGDVIVWENRDIFEHTATARDDSFDVDLPPDSEASVTLETAGTFDFYCRFHPGMTGTLVVAE